MASIGAALGAQYFRARHLIKVAIHDEGEKIRKQLYNTISDQILEMFNQFLLVETIQYRLFRTLDIDEPSLWHPVPDDVKKYINEYLVEFDKMRKNYHRLNLMAGDYERQGDAYHYLYGLKNEIEAIKNYEQALLRKGNVDDDGYAEPTFWTRNIKRKLANAYAGAKKYQKAIEIYSDIEKDIMDKKGKDDARVQISWGDALHNEEEFDKACERYNKAIKILEPDKKRMASLYWGTVYQYGNSLAAMGVYDIAIAQYDEIIAVSTEGCTEIDPWIRWVYHSKGDAQRASRQYKPAIESYEECIKRVENHSETLFKLGKTLVALEEYREAIIRFDKAKMAIQRDRDAGEIHTCSAEKHISLLRRVRRMLRKLSSPALLPQEEQDKYEMPHWEPRLWAYHGYALKKCGDDKATSFLNTALAKARELSKKDDLDTEAFYSLALSYAMQGDAKHAMGNLEKAIKLNRYAIKWARAADYSDFIGICRNSEEKNDFTEFLDGLEKKFPMIDCSRHYSENLASGRATAEVKKWFLIMSNSRHLILSVNIKTIVPRATHD